METTASVPVLDRSAGLEVITDHLDRHGAVVIDQLVDPAVMDRIHDELAVHLEATPFGVEDFAGKRTRRTGSLIARSPTFRELAMHPTVIGTLDRVLGDHTTTYQLHLTQVIDLAPGQG